MNKKNNYFIIYWLEGNHGWFQALSPVICLPLQSRQANKGPFPKHRLFYLKLFKKISFFKTIYIYLFRFLDLRNPPTLDIVGRNLGILSQKGS